MFCSIVFTIMITSIIVPASAITVSKPMTHLLQTGNILYVGGSGPNNYTKIQDAIDNASVGDTVFVYDDSSPYYESLNVDQPVTLRGEDKNTTIIDNSHTVNHGVFIDANNVTVTGFTIQNGGTGVYVGGVTSTASHNIIDNNLFLNVSMGVDIYYGDPFTPEFTDYGYNIISNNIIRYSKFDGIRIVESRDNIVTGNDIAPDEQFNISYGYGYGIDVSGAFNNISYNMVYSSVQCGILSGPSYKNLIYRNTLQDNDYGVVLTDASFDRVIQNNFINNSRSARIYNFIKWSFEAHRGHYLMLPSIWDGNYWDKPRTMPKVIAGLCGYNGLIITLFADVLFQNTNHQLWTYLVDYVRIDWHPAQEPYPQG